MSIDSAYAPVRVSRRSVLGAIAAAIAPRAWAGRTFELQWTEEVELASGTVLLVSLKYTYESLSVLDRYNPAILRRTDIEFHAGKEVGAFSRSFDHHRVDMIQRVEDRWYLVLETRGGPPYEILPDGKRQQIWGPPENYVGQKCWVLDARGFRRSSILEIPDSMLKPNLLMDYAPVKELASLNGKHVTLQMKADISARHPVSPPAGQIVRPVVSPRK